jgi:hypothetical protein
MTLCDAHLRVAVLTSSCHLPAGVPLYAKLCLLLFEGAHICCQAVLSVS